MRKRVLDRLGNWLLRVDRAVVKETERVRAEAEALKVAGGGSLSTAPLVGRMEPTPRRGDRTECEHQPNLSSITPADGAPGIVDVPCVKCGVLGSVRVPWEEIQWEEPELTSPQ